MKHRFLGLLVVALALSACGGEPDPSEQVARTEENIWSTAWDDLGYQSSGGPGASPWSGHNLTLFWRTSTNHLYHSWQPEGGDWQAIEDLATGVASDPSATSAGDGWIEVVWRSSSSHLMYKPYFNGFGATVDLGGSLPSGPAAVTWPGSFLSVFWRSSSNHLMHRWLDYASGAWSANEDFGRTLGSDPAVMYRGTDPSGGGALFDIFWRATSGHLMHATMPYNGQWAPSPEEDLGGLIASGTVPTAAPRDPGQSLDVFWQGTDAKLKHKFYRIGSGWSAVDTVDSSMTLASSPEAMSWGPGRVDVFVKSGSTLKHRVWSSSMYVDLRAQTQSNWCWATTGQMISRYWGHEFSQCQQASHASGKNCCATPSSAACNVGGLADYAWMGFATNDTSSTGAPITVAQAQSMAALKRPWDHGIIWVGGGAHGVVGTDLFWFDNQYWVTINDPSPQNQGSNYVQTYSDYLGIPGVSIGDWDYYNIRPFGL